MANKNQNYHLTTHPKGGWQGKREGAVRASILADTKKEAEKQIKQLIASQGGGELRIHGVKGTIIDSDTIKPANDPNPPKDQKH